MKQNFWQQRFSLLVLIVFLFLCPFTFAVDGAATVKVGFYPLAGLQDIAPDGSLSGYMYDYLQEIAKTTNWKYDFYVGDFADCLDKLKKGELDFVGGMQYVEERTQYFDFPDYSCGFLYLELFVKNTNTKYSYNDTQAFNGMAVGVIRGFAGNSDFTQYCQDNNFTVKLKEYAGFSELKQALNQGEIDGFCSISAIPREGLSSVAAFGYKGFYIMVAKNKKDLLGQLNIALEKIKFHSSFYEQGLQARYFPSKKNTVPVFTLEERDYIEKHGTVDVVYNKNWKPLEQYDEKTGEFTGIIADIFNLVSNLSGLKFNYIPVESHLVAYEQLFGDQARLKCTAPNDYHWAEKYNFRISNEYLNVPVVMISGSKKKSGKLIVAMPEGLHLTERVLRDFPEYDYVLYPSYDDCLEALMQKKASACFADMHVASGYLNRTKYSSMKISPLNGYTARYCVGFSHSSDTILVSIIDKTLACISTDQINALVLAHTVSYKAVTPLDVVYQNPLQSILAISLFFALFIILLLVILRNRTRYSKHLYAVVNVDALTGISSQAKFRQDAAKLLADQKQRQYLLIYINISKFKDINELYGYSVGDRVLLCVCRELVGSLHSGELLTRFHSDHFAALLECSDADGLHKWYAAVVEQVARSLQNEGLPGNIRLMAGAYFLSRSDMDVNVSTDRARYALRQCYLDYSTSIVVYDEKLDSKVQTERSLEADMEAALAGGEFVVYYQSQINSQTDTIEGAEALIRWQNPAHGLLSPAVFVPLFEKNTFILKIDYFVFEEVCRYLASRKERGKELFPISCNFSRLHFMDDTFVDKLVGIADRFNIERHLAVIEITESMAIEDSTLVKLQLEKLKKKGFSISIDDFGSGYSSLGILSEIEFDEIKIDRALVINASLSESSRLILSGIVSTIQSLNKTIVCEGVETELQTQLLSNIHCYTIQGYYYARPIPEKDFDSNY